MTTLSTTSLENTTPSGTTKLVSEKFALLARVGHQKKKLSASLEETTYYSGIVSELHALVADMLAAIQDLPEKTFPLEKELEFKLRQKNLVKNLLYTFPEDSEFRTLRSRLLTSAGLESAVTLTSDGWLTPSTALTLDLVALSLGATKEERQSLLHN